MAYKEWQIRGPSILNCNCDWGCPCQFNALPTYGDCRGVVAMEIEEGHFEDIPLDGVRFALMVAWPKAIHEGHGEALPIIDSSATEEQRNALLTIISGQESEPGATIFNVFAATFDKVHDPVFTKIDFEADKEARTARARVEGLLDTRVEPIRNPVTGAEHRIQVSIPEGFEYRHAEYASGNTRTEGPVPMSWEGRHAHIATLNLSTHGAA
ncbi:MAG TPA: DUF1326 domain-containing protein [Allosphingosinicella sp.]|nr:DUF1326 domain-containing protein [Allosphingosinicella sp.]